jgi:hypothetical protein
MENPLNVNCNPFCIRGWKGRSMVDTMYVYSYTETMALPFPYIMTTVTWWLSPDFDPMVCGVNCDKPVPEYCLSPRNIIFVINIRSSSIHLRSYGYVPCRMGNDFHEVHFDRDQRDLKWPFPGIKMTACPTFKHLLSTRPWLETVLIVNRALPLEPRTKPDAIIGIQMHGFTHWSINSNSTSCESHCFGGRGSPFVDNVIRLLSVHKCSIVLVQLYRWECQLF